MFHQWIIPFPRDKQIEFNFPSREFQASIIVSSLCAAFVEVNALTSL
jgi:hypothetical protein